MSVALFQNQRARGPANPAQIQKMLDENNQLIQAILDAQNKGKASESIHFQNILHRNLTYLASLADPNPNLAAIIPPPQSFGQPQPQQSQGNIQPPSECMPPPPPPAPHTLGPPTSSSTIPNPNSGPPQPTTSPPSSNTGPNVQPHQYGSMMPPPRPPSSTNQPPNSYGSYQHPNQQYNQGQYPPTSGYSSYGNYNSNFATPPLSSQYGAYPNYPQPGYTNAPPQPPPVPAQGAENWYPPTGSQQTSGYSSAAGYNQYSQPGYGTNYAAPNPGPSPSASYVAPTPESSAQTHGAQTRPGYNQQAGYGHFQARGPAPMGAYPGYDQSVQGYPGP